MSVPDHIRKQLRKQLWGIADDIGWTTLSTTDKKNHYEQWTRDPTYGGTLARYIDKGQVRVYLKDTIMKEYARAASADCATPLRLLGIPHDAPTIEQYIKPHGRRLNDGRVICWGRAGDWKLVLMAIHERAATHKNTKPFGVILDNATGKYAQTHIRHIIEDAAKKLLVQKLIWRPH